MGKAAVPGRPDSGRASDSPDLVVRWGGFAFIAGGALGVAAEVLFSLLAAGVLSPLSPGYEYFEDYYRGKRLLNVLYDLPGPIGALLVAAGMVALYALLAERAERPAKLAKMGVFLAVPAAALVAVLDLYRALLQPQPYAYGPPQSLTVYEAVSAAAYLAVPAGILLLGIGSLRARGLGRWRFLPLALSPLSVPVVELILFGPRVGGEVEGVLYGPAAMVFVGARAVLLNGGWILLGALLVGARRRESALREAENLALARRLYEEVVGKGDLWVVDEIVVPEMVDHHHAGRGPEGFKRVVADLRATFPDLRFEIEAQRSQGDTVVTRWSARGTDRGGVLWYPPTGKAASFAGAYTDRFSDGALVEHWGESDTAALLDRLGLPPPSG